MREVHCPDISLYLKQSTSFENNEAKCNPEHHDHDDVLLWGLCPYASVTGALSYCRKVLLSGHARMKWNVMGESQVLKVGKITENICSHLVLLLEQSHPAFPAPYRPVLSHDMHTFFFLLKLAMESNHPLNGIMHCVWNRPGIAADFCPDYF